MENQPKIFTQIMDLAQRAWETLRGWALEPAAWSQFPLLAVAFIAAWYASAHLRKLSLKWLTPRQDTTGIRADILRTCLLFVPLIFPILAYAFTGLGEQVTRTIFGSGEVIAFGKRAILFLAARAFVRDILPDGFLKILGRYILLPAMGLYVLGLWDQTVTALNGFSISLGNIKFSAMTILRAFVAGGLLFWLGRWSNSQSSALIDAQEQMPQASRQLAIKASEIAIFGIAFLLFMNVMGFSLTSLAVIGGAIGVGLGFGLQKIASNFISGIILLLEGQATVGDYVALDGGEQGTIVKMTMRATILETFDGRWIVVPNEDFITTRVTNYSDQGSANRFEVAFSVHYQTDINKVPEIIEAAVATHPEVLDAPFPPDCEFRAFGENGIEFAVEFWVNGLDDGANKYTSDVRFIVWNALRDNQIQIPYPHRVIEISNLELTPN